MRLQSRTRATACMPTPTVTDVGTHIERIWHPRGDTAQKPQRDPCASLCTRRAGRCAGPPDDRHRDSGVYTHPSAGERTEWSPNGEPSWRRAASELPANRLRRRGAGTQWCGPARLCLPRSGGRGNGAGSACGLEAARGGRGAGFCPSARISGKGTVSAGIGWRVPV